MTDDRKDLTVFQVAVLLGFTPRHILNLIDSGHFPNAYKMNPTSRSRYRIPQKDVDVFLALRGKKSVKTSP